MTPAPRALLDTSVVIHPPANIGEYAEAMAISTISLAELAFGLHTADPVETTIREARYQRVLSEMEPIPYDASAARMYGALCAAVLATGRSPRPRRFDLMIASVAASERLPLLTRNPDDFAGIHSSLQVVDVR